MIDRKCGTGGRKRRRHASIRGRMESLEPRQLLAGDLIAQWVADSLTTTVSNDQAIALWQDSVSQTAATAIGTPTLVDNLYSGRAVVRFDPTDGGDGFLVAEADSPMSGATDYSVVVVFATDSLNLQGTTGPWFENTGLVDADRLGLGKDWGVSINRAGQIATGMGEGFLKPTATVYSDLGGLNDGQLHVVTVTRGGSDLAIFVDGQPSGQINDANAAPRDTIAMTIGTLATNGGDFSGDIAEVRIYNGQLTASEVSAVTGQIDSFYHNQAPTAVDDTYAFAEDPIFGFHSVLAPLGVLANDTDVEGDALTASIVDNVQHGNVALAPDGSFIYRADDNFFGTDTFTYTANDSQTSNVATVTINVANVYDAAVPRDDTYSGLPTQTLNIPAFVGVLANDENPDQVNLTAMLDTDETAGRLTFRTDGSFTYDPQGIAGTQTFSYRVDDGTQSLGPVTVRLVINTPPVASADEYLLAEDVPLVVGPVAGVLANDVDADGDPLQAQLVAPPQQGSLVLNADGSFVYTPLTDYQGPDQFTYQVSDGEAFSPVVTVELTIQSVNDAPVAQADAYFGRAAEALEVSAARGLLANDLDVDSATLTARLVEGPATGLLTLRADGSFTYSPDPAFQGTVTFTYAANDGQTDSGPTEVTLFVDAAPVVINELMAANATVLTTRVRTSSGDRFRGEDSTPDWIELKNLTSSDFDVSGFHLTDDPSDPLRWSFPAGTIIPAGGYLVVLADRLNVTDPDLDELGLMHTNFKLDVLGEFLGLTSPGGELIFSFSPEYPEQRADLSYGLSAAGTVGYLTTPTPGAANVTTLFAGIVSGTDFSIDRGFYSEPIDVAITTASDGAVIRYTTDGSPPSATVGEVYSGPITITTTTVLKAVAVKEGYIPSEINSHTYLYAEDIFQQDGSGLGGVRWGHRGPDWEMDPKIVNNEDPEIRPELEDLQRIPTVSLSLDFDEMFGRGGIYVQGENVERPVSFEFFDPNRPDNGTQTNSTVQIVGGSSPNRWKSDKLSMRVRFTEDAGDSKLNYPVFGADAVTQFDTLVVDARLNNVWHYGGGSDPLGQQGRAQYMRDEYASDLQNALGGYGTHGQHVNVYINGIYWGVHTLHERPDENFAESYLGGVGEDYDVLKHTANEVVNGTRDAFRQFNSMLGTRGDLTDEQWEQAKEQLDIDNFINYMLVNFYGGNRDWDHHNWYASRNRVGGKWRFHSRDAEKVLEGVRDDATSTNNRNSPTGIHRRLMTYPEYKLRFADLVQKHFFNDGALTPDNAAALYKWRSDQIDLVTRVESARWGDNQVDRSRKTYTRLDWVRVRNQLMNDYFPRRTDIVLDQFVRRGWIEGKDLAPRYQINGEDQHGGFVQPGSRLSIVAGEGTIYFTTDGSDPRLEGGDVSMSAVVYSQEVALQQTTLVKARIRQNDGTWSPLSEARFSTSVPADGSSLRISEFDYHPADPSPAEEAAGFDNADDFEFIELVNISDRPIDLRQVRLIQVPDGDNLDGVSFNFADGAVAELQPSEFVIVAEDAAAFRHRYGEALPLAGQWSGRLSNSSERIVLVAGDETIHDFTYFDTWHPTTDGAGFTMQAVNPAASDLGLWNTKAGWRPSSRIGGTPGRAEGRPVVGDSNGDGVFNSADLLLVFQAGEYEDAIDGNSVFAEGDWDGDGDFTTRDLLFAFQQGNYVAAATPISATLVDGFFAHERKRGQASFTWT